MEFIFNPFVLNTYDDIKPYLDDLVHREVKTKEETEQRIKDYDTLQAHIGEDFSWRYVRHTCDTENEELKKAYNYFITEIGPKLQEIDDVLNKKIIALPGITEMSKENEAYEIRLRGVKKALEMFRAENIPLKTELSEKERLYGEIAGAMTIEHEGKTLTLQQAAKYLEFPDRAIRKTIYEKIQARRQQDYEKLDNLLSELIVLRNTIAQNAGYPSYVEYQREALNRFDYTQQDVFDFWEGMKQHIVPLLHNVYEEKREKLGLETLTPYDIFTEGKDEQPLRPFETGEELLEKGIETMGDLDPSFGDNLRTMEANHRFDLSSRTGKAPGGYNCPMPVSRYPFIFMNAAGTQRDIETFVHESGHAMHSFYMKDLPLSLFKNYPMEIAEVASMSMELLTMYLRGHFYHDKNDLKKAQKFQIEGSLETLPRVAVIDSYQYWLYKNPHHTIADRDQKFKELIHDYQPRIDYTGYELFQAKRRQAQLHIYEVPFYYIEYGIAQLGAIGVWKNYITDPKKALDQYKAALALGYTKKLPELYKTAGIPFDFSPARIKELADFVWKEREKIVGQ